MWHQTQKTTRNQKTTPTWREEKHPYSQLKKIDPHEYFIAKNLSFKAMNHKKFLYDMFRFFSIFIKRFVHTNICTYTLSVFVVISKIA